VSYEAVFFDFDRFNGMGSVIRLHENRQNGTFLGTSGHTGLH
jgi:hypothetical protein